jgi:flagellin
VSFRINTNISSLNALRNLQTTENRMQTVTTRLSTGLRINSASEDPAGMVISEGMRSQINGIQQAVRNAQDAVNMMKTAEGALDEVQGILRNLKALAVHSANTGVVDANQLRANQQTYRNAIESINKIAEHTQWGTKKLLNGAAGTSIGITRQDLVQSLYLGNTIGGKIMADGNVTMAQTQAAAQTTTGALANTFAAPTSSVNPGTVVINGVTITVNAGETLSGLVSKINERSGDSGVTANLTGSGPYSVSLTSTKFGSQFGIQYAESANILNNNQTATGAGGQDAIYQVTTNVQGGGTATETFTGGQGPNVDGLTLTSQGGGRLTISATGNSNPASAIVGVVKVGTMRFQLGANSEQSSAFAMPSIASDKLGTSIFTAESLATVDLTNQEGATKAIDIVDAAINELSMLRGDMGSFQANFLESTMRSLAVAEENLTASESAIRDADMAKEMTEFTKIQILRQSGMSILAQANQSQQSVLSLLQGG